MLAYLMSAAMTEDFVHLYTSLCVFNLTLTCAGSATIHLYLATHFPYPKSKRVFKFHWKVNKEQVKTLKSLSYEILNNIDLTENL